ncbi:MAG: hypothetical protein E6K82_06865 [Candidatus Rokuibacteriota bacterium]|nr:MAG: hypothetical protein E6K82_06865 [Candidatus Rokubacteria bacterium]
MFSWSRPSATRRATCGGRSSASSRRPPVFRTPLGRLATFICYDGWFPESYRLCALQGGPASPDREEIIYAEANLADARRKRNWNEYQVLRDRRTDVYDEMLGAKLSRGWY